MIDLSARQIQILRAIIEEFINTAASVGSETIDKKFNIGVSPATIRNEMVYLTNQGYLSKSHSSAGRIPTPMALRLYVNELMKEKELSVADEVSTKEKVWKSKNKTEDLWHEVAKFLADRSQAVGIVLTEDKHLYHSGYANLLKMPEFADLEIARNALTLIEEANLLDEIFTKAHSENPVQVVYGPELGNRYLEPVGMVFVSTNVCGQVCQVGALGSTRFNYPYLVSMMKYLKGLIEEMVE